MAYWLVPGRSAVHGLPDAAYTLRGARHGDPKVSGYKPSDFKIPTLREVLKAFPDTRSISRSRAPATPTSPPSIAPRASWRRS